MNGITDSKLLEANKAQSNQFLNLTIEKIPLELLKKVFAYLENPLDVQSAVSVCKLWQKTIIDLSFRQEIDFIKKNFAFLRTHTNKSFRVSSEEDFVLMIQVSAKKRVITLDSKNLITIKSSMIKFKENMFYALKTLTKEEQIRLSEKEHELKCFPLFVEMIFKVGFEMSNRIEVEKQKQTAFYQILHTLDRFGQFTLALDVVEKMHPDYQRNALSIIYHDFIESGHVDKAAELARRNPFLLTHPFNEDS